MLPILRGKPSARTQKAIAAELGVKVRRVQDAIEEARLEGEGICTGRPGVWLPESADELARSNRILHKRLRSQYRTLRAQQKAERRMRLVEEGSEALTLWQGAA